MQSNILGRTCLTLFFGLRTALRLVISRSYTNARHAPSNLLDRTCNPSTLILYFLFYCLCYSFQHGPLYSITHGRNKASRNEAIFSLIKALNCGCVMQSTVLITCAHSARLIGYGMLGHSNLDNGCGLRYMETDLSSNG